jgi:UbiD family decarboxylase
MYKDLREFIELVEKLGALRRIEGADPRFEIGAITEIAAGRSDGPALLFDAIKGFPRGFRIFTNATTSPQRAALALGIDPTLRPLDASRSSRARPLRSRRPLFCNTHSAAKTSTSPSFRRPSGIATMAVPSSARPRS